MTEPLTSDTLGKVFQIDLDSRKCFAKRNGCKEPLCGHTLSKISLCEAKGILENRITYLPGDEASIDEDIMKLARLLIQSSTHGKRGPRLVLDFAEDLRGLMNEHYKSREQQSIELAVADPEPTSVPATPISVTQLNCAEIADAIEASEVSETNDSSETSDVGKVTYPALLTTHTFAIEETKELNLDSSIEPYPGLPSSNTQPHSVAKSPTPLPDKVLIPSNPVTNALSLPSNPLLSLVLNIINQMLVGFFSSVQARRGVVPVENTSGQTKNRSVVDLKILLGLRIPTGMLPALLFVVAVGLYCQAWSVIASLVLYVLIAVACASCSRWISSGSEVVV